VRCAGAPRGGASPTTAEDTTGSTTGSTTDGVHEVAELLTASRTARLTTTAADGTLVSRPTAVLEVEFDGDRWSSSELVSCKVSHIARQSAVNVTVAAGASWVSLTGPAEVVDDVGL